MPVIIATDRAGQVHEVNAETGVSLMENLKFKGSLDIAAICGGSCACATCHVYVAEDWLERLEPADGSEQELVSESLHHRPQSRLSCQIRVSDELDGLRVTLAPED
ncbi:2Fe-2S iron-sulfur cluster-binding protein [Terrarubrum flagellatum]|uniref:2Fe-2S iron-sulfur cluster-binding protein n=1 Tax=Terrirubrum flagellatum TaxID=2895980 RepID=UPI00314511C2